MARAIFPPCFNVWPSFGGYKPREQYWDLDFEGRRPVLFSFNTPFSTIRAYYIPPLMRPDTKKVVVAYPGNTRAVGSLMKDFWSLFGNDVHLIVVNPPGYGNFDADRSLPMVGADDRLLEAWLRAIPSTIEKELLEPSAIDWIKLNPIDATKDRHNSIVLSPVANLDDLPRRFSNMEITVFGRSAGAFLASCHPIRPKIYYTPFQSVEKIESAGMLGLLWRVGRPFTTFPNHTDNQTFLDSFNGKLEPDQRKFIEDYDCQVFTGLQTNLAAMLLGNFPCLLSLATEDDVVGTFSIDFLEKVKVAHTVTLVSIEGRHNVLPNNDYKNNIRLFLAATRR